MFNLTRFVSSLVKIQSATLLLKIEALETVVHSIVLYLISGQGDNSVWLSMYIAINTNHVLQEKYLGLIFNSFISYLL